MKKEKIFFAFCLWLLIYFPNETLSQNFTNRGKDFWVGHMGHIDGVGSNFKLYITSDVNTSGTVSVPLQGWSVPFTVIANTITIVPVPSATAYTGCSDCIEQNGIHVVSNDDIAAYAHIFSSARSDATLMLPTQANGKEYYALCYAQSTTQGFSEFLIVALEDSTLVEITPKATLIGGKPANIPFNITLQQGEVYQAQSSGDLTGSKILSLSSGNNVCKKIAVFSGNTWTSVGCPASADSGDNLFEQMYPVNKWGKEFITSPLKTRLGDEFRVIAQSNGTIVTINGVPHSLNQAQYYDAFLTTPAYYSSNKPVMLAQYARTQICDGKTGDPFMIILSPIEQAVNNILLYCSPQQAITGEYINIVMKTADVGNFLLDGTPVTFNPVPANTIYSYSQNTVTVGTHSIVADSGFNAIAYGFGNIESYGYLAGTNIKNLRQQSASFNPLPACSGSILNFTPATSHVPDSWKWYFGDNTSSISQYPTHTYSDSGTYIVSLVTTYSSDCVLEQDSTFHIIHINGSPSADFSSSTVCLGNTTLFNDNSTMLNGDTINSWQWSFGDGNNSVLQNPVHTYITCDTFSVKLIATSNNGCKDSTTNPVTVNCLPTANFTANPVCKGQATIFHDVSIGTISTWNWSFGDGTPLDSAQTPFHVFASGGNYNVTLIVTNSVGCADTITKPVQVYYKPTVDFTHSDVCVGDSMYFINTSSINLSTSIASYLWIFGDGSANSGLKNPSHFYSTAGTYTVTLVIKTADSCSDAVSIAVNVYDAPVSGFTFSNTCLNDSAVFTNTSLYPTTGTISNWSWNFGDNTPLNTTVWSPHHLYSSPGNYQVTLITYSSTLGCPDTLKATINVFPMPVANFSSANVCLHQMLNFYDSSTVANGTIASWSWNFGDGINTTQNPGITYSNAGTYAVNLIATSNNGCKDTATKVVVVHPLPVPQFSFSNVCDGDSVHFNNFSTIPSTDTIQFCTLNLFDGSAPLTINTAISHLYPGTGTYTVRLFAVSTFGCIDSLSKTVIVNPEPVVDFTADDTVGCEPVCVNFQNLSTIATGNNAHWLWDFGNFSAGSTTQNPLHCYINDSVFAPIIYPVSLTATSDSGCVTSLTKNNYITVYPMPVASFTVDPEIATNTYPVISFSNESTGANFWRWNFGGSATLTTGNDTSHLENPLPHTYPDTGTYLITLITSTLYNCLDTAYHTIIIEPDFLFYIPNAFSPNGDYINETFQGYGIGIKEYEMTIFDRWGNQLYKTKDYNLPWDGKVNDGKEIGQQDVYIYVIKVTDVKTKKHNYKGIVTLVR